MSISSNTMAQPKLTWMEAITEDLQAVIQKMQSVSFLDNQLIDAAVDMILTAGGKRVRPALTILSSRIVEAKHPATIAVAASVELLHTATLVHDDLVDDSPSRRGVPTLHTKLPLGVTVLTGDFLFAQAAALAAEAESVRVVQVFANTLVAICRGEILQAQTRWQVPSDEIYQQRIYGKTAALYEAAALSGAIIGNKNENTIQALGEFGRELGIAFQIVDDALDFTANAEKLGKPAGHDLRQGHITLPSMLYVKENNMSVEDFIDRASDEETVDELIADIRNAGMAKRSLDIAKGHIKLATSALERIEWTDEINLLQEMAQYVVDRDF